MRIFLAAVAGIGGLLLWLLIKLERTYTISHKVFVQPAIGNASEVVSVEVEGKGYALFFWRRIDTISVARLCMDPPRGAGRVSLRWNLSELNRSGICKRLKPTQVRVPVRWVLPAGADLIEPPFWRNDTVWSLTDSLPLQEYELVAQIGRRSYPIPLPSEWGVYPETLWVEAHVASYIYAITEVVPQPEGVDGYTLLLQPDQVQVRFWIPQSMADRWKPSDFQVVVDMNKVMPGDSLVYPELRRRPPYARRIEIIPSALRFTRLY
ncbi:MAG: hypothetical protein RMK19_04510 [Bacteroidia bacterium]|nr:hypothetical protein [Bacteroidia bacterium]MDW8015254.1 hypothetical protein [Bacteroidia bacterium]